MVQAGKPAPPSNTSPTFIKVTDNTSTQETGSVISQPSTAFLVQPNQSSTASETEEQLDIAQKGESKPNHETKVTDTYLITVTKPVIDGNTEQEEEKVGLVVQAGKPAPPSQTSATFIKATDNDVSTQERGSVISQPNQSSTIYKTEERLDIEQSKQNHETKVTDRSSTTVVKPVIVGNAEEGKASPDNLSPREDAGRDTDIAIENMVSLFIY